MIAGAERADRDTERLLALELASQRTRPVTIERDSNRQAGAVDSLERDDAPGCAVQLDRDPVAVRAAAAR